MAHADKADAISWTVDRLRGEPGIAIVLPIRHRNFLSDGIEVRPFFRFDLDGKHIKIFFRRWLSLAGCQHREQHNRNRGPYGFPLHNILLLVGRSRGEGQRTRGRGSRQVRDRGFPSSSNSRDTAWTLAQSTRNQKLDTRNSSCFRRVLLEPRLASEAFPRCVEFARRRRVAFPRCARSRGRCDIRGR